jgi:hypothetical protein
MARGSGSPHAALGQRHLFGGEIMLPGLFSVAFVALKSLRP